MSEMLIDVNNVSKKMCRDLRRSLAYGFRDLVVELLGSSRGRTSLRESEFWAVRDVSLSVRRGECLALIGRNGAGKTTLLRMLTGLIRPDYGRIEMRGAVGAMIALGAGMKDILTGRDNILAMAALRGMNRKEARAKVDEIIDFAELREAIDAPLQSYSSGMRVRLNFAIASAMDPDILLLDEVLAVGDAAFRNKCYRRISDLRRRTAVVFVSHNMEQVARICTHAVVMSAGRVVFAGGVDEAVVNYGKLNDDGGRLQQSDAFLSLSHPVVGFEATLARNSILSGESFETTLDVECSSAVGAFLVKVLFYNSSGTFSADGVVDAGLCGVRLGVGHNRLRVLIDSLPLKNGFYSVAFNVIDDVGDLVVWSHKMHLVEVKGAYVGGISDCQLRIGLQREMSDL